MTAITSMALVKRQHGPAWRKVPKISGSRWGFIGLMAGIALLLLLSLIICICCIRSNKKKKRLRYAAQGQDLSTTHPEPTYGRKNATSKPAMRPTSGRVNGGYGEPAEQESFVQDTAESNYSRPQRRPGGAGMYNQSHSMPMEDTHSTQYGPASQGGYDTTPQMYGGGGYNGGYGGYAQGHGPGTPRGEYGSEFQDEYGNGGYVGQQQQQHYADPHAQSQAQGYGMAYSGEQAGYPQQHASAYDPSIFSQGSAQPAAVQQGSYGYYDDQSQFSHPQQPPSRPGTARPAGGANPLPAVPMPTAQGAYPQSSSYHDVGAQQYGGQHYGQYSQQTNEAGGSGYGQALSHDYATADGPPAYDDEPENDGAGPSTGQHGVPGGFHVPPEKSRDV